jgi:hypothetical protein
MQNDAMRRREQARVLAESGAYDPSPSACLAYGLSKSIGAGKGETPSLNGYDIANRGRNWARGIGPRSDEVKEGPGAIADGIIRDRDAFQDLNGYFDPTSDIRFLSEQMTIDTDDEKVAQALWRLQQNIIDPAPPQPATEPQADTPEGKIEIARRQVDEARKSTAWSLFGFLTNLATPVSAASAKVLNKVKPADYPRQIPEKPSLRQSLDVMVAYYNSPEFLEKIQRSSPEAVARENVLLQAFNARLQWLQLDLNLRRGAIDAAQLVVDTGAGERALGQ